MIFGTIHFLRWTPASVSDSTYVHLLLNLFFDYGLWLAMTSNDEDGESFFLVGMNVSSGIFARAWLTSISLST